MTRKPDWRAVTYEALSEPGALMRVFADLGFTAHHGTVQRGTISWWTPAYLLAAGNNPHRPCFAAANRAMRDADVHMLSTSDRTVFAVCSYQGEWRTVDGAQRGDDLISLGVLRWSLRFGQAAARISRVIGLDRVPRVEPVTTAQTWAEIHARLRGVAA